MTSTSTAYTETYIPGPQNTLFYTRLYPSPNTKALIIGIHGFNDHIGRFTHVHTPLARAGLAVFAFDQRGFGQTVQKAENGAGRKYAWTSWREQMEDLEWAVAEGRKACAGVPVFLYGHSMGGGLSLAFPTRTPPQWPHPSPESISLLSGVIATSPLLIITHPPSSIKRWLGGKLASVSPRTTIPAVVNGADLSRDPQVGELCAADPLIRQVGSLRGMSDMLSGGERLLESDYKNWPKALPLLLVHGTSDQVTSHKATQAFFDSVDAEDKKLSLYEGGYHELQSEPDGVQEKLVDEIVRWVESHLPPAVGGSGGEGAGDVAAEVAKL